MTKIFDNISLPNKRKLLYLLQAHSFTFNKDSSLQSFVKNENIIGIITSGYIQIIRTDANDNRIIIEELYEEDIFGTQISNLKNNDYNIITKEDTEVILIDYKEIINSPFNNKAFYLKFIQNLLDILTTKIIEKNERIEILTKKTIRNKLLEYFNLISNKHNSKYVYLPSTFTDLADYLAIDRSAMSRELKNLKEEGLIEIKGKKIILLYNDKWI